YSPSLIGDACPLVGFVGPSPSTLQIIRCVYNNPIPSVFGFETVNCNYDIRSGIAMGPGVDPLCLDALVPVPLPTLPRLPFPSPSLSPTVPPLSSLPAIPTPTPQATVSANGSLVACTIPENGPSAECAPACACGSYVGGNPAVAGSPATVCQASVICANCDIGCNTDLDCLVGYNCAGSCGGHRTTTTSTHIRMSKSLFSKFRLASPKVSGPSGTPNGLVLDALPCTVTLHATGMGRKLAVQFGSGSRATDRRRGACSKMAGRDAWQLHRPGSSPDWPANQRNGLAEVGGIIGPILATSCSKIIFGALLDPNQLGAILGALLDLILDVLLVPYFYFSSALSSTLAEMRDDASGLDAHLMTEKRLPPAGQSL
ncbi:hypothetical protein KFL_008820010, partial [Klebsormidium nitens]